jgi:hypothetical protein
MARRNNRSETSTRKPIFAAKKPTAEVIKLHPAQTSEPKQKIKSLAGLKDILVRPTVETKVETPKAKVEEVPAKRFRFNNTEKSVKAAVEAVLENKQLTTSPAEFLEAVATGKRIKIKPTETKADPVVKEAAKSQTSKAKEKPEAKAPIVIVKEEKVKPQTSEEKPKPAVKAAKLPHIDDLFTLIQNHTSALSRAINNSKWGEIAKLQNKFKSDMEAMGVAEYFDWTETEEKKVIRRKVDKLANK